MRPAKRPNRSRAVLPRPMGCYEASNAASSLKTYLGWRDMAPIWKPHKVLAEISFGPHRGADSSC